MASWSTLADGIELGRQLGRLGRSVGFVPERPDVVDLAADVAEGLGQRRLSTTEARPV